VGMGMGVGIGGGEGGGVSVCWLFRPVAPSPGLGGPEQTN